MTPPPFFDVRQRGFRDRTDVADVWALIDERIRELPAEDIPALSAVGRRLASAVVASVDVPGFDRAAMDGYALRAEETFGAGSYNPLELRVIGVAWPGRPFTGELQAGQAVRIMTGAPVPAGADAVLPVEYADERDGIVSVRDAVPPGRHIGRRGEDVATGRDVLPIGRVLRPQDIGLLASIGTATVSVVRRPRVAILITGDELLPAGATPEGHRIVDSNSPMLAGLIVRDGGVVLPTIMLADRAELLRQQLQSTKADVVLISGGSSVGQEDHAPAVVAELGTLPVHGVAVRPASPTGVGFLAEGRPVFLLPGNPVSCLCAYDLFAGRALRRLTGDNKPWGYRSVTRPLASKLVSAVGRVDYVRVRLTDGEVTPLAISGASQLSSTVVADGFVLVERDREGHAPGEMVTVWLYDDL